MIRARRRRRPRHPSRIRACRWPTASEPPVELASTSALPLPRPVLAETRQIAEQSLVPPRL